MSRKATGKVNAALEKALADEVKEITRRHPEDYGDREKRGKFVYELIDRSRVYDRALKLEALKLKADDPEWGKEFNKDRSD